MDCPHCKHALRDGANFCDRCGASQGGPGLAPEPGSMLQTILDLLPHPIYLKDKDGRYLFTNRAMAEHHGVSVEHFRGLHTSELPNRTSSELRSILEADEAVIRSGETVEVPEIEVHLAQGRTAWQRMVKVPLRGADGEIVGIVGLAEDITQRLEAERMVQQLHAQLTDAIESLPSGFAMYDSDERLVYWNGKIEQYFPNLKGRLKRGMRYEDILAIGYADLSEPRPPRDEWIAERLHKFRREPGIYEQRLSRNRHTQVMQTHTSRGGRVRIHVDVSEQKYVQQRLLDANERIARDLALAGEFQASLHPPIRHFPFARVEGRHLPAGRVSGDLYDLTQGLDGQMEFFIGDATGHDLAAAFLTMMVRVGLESTRRMGGPATVLERLNGLIAALELQGKFITGVYLRMAPDGRLIVSNAGHPPVLHLPANGGAPALLGRSGMALGMFREPPVDYTEEARSLAAGDRLIALTDGLMEWRAGTGNEFGWERVQHFLTHHRELGLGESLDGLIAEVSRFADGYPREDDLTIFGIEYGDHAAS